ncbi:hypothetical protein FNF28_04321 [Cafeteria roenbergensis]|uniref:Uncharacterized protein n=1 Tax=Cafeteria roenbergensis TaxID=33653 RepID=A0A5A8DCE8_CAFRO|nr:hypothetical protein FNF28_04321 [Cafeteria roenbergensis]
MARRADLLASASGQQHSLVGDPLETGTENVVAVGALGTAVVFVGGVVTDVLRREAGRRRLDGGTVLGATAALEAVTGGAAAMLAGGLGGGRDTGVVFVLLVVLFLALVSALGATWERAAAATAATELERQSFVFVLELTTATFTVLVFVLSQRLDDWEFWASIALKAFGVIFVDTRLHQDIARGLRAGVWHLQYTNSREAAVFAARAERSLLAEQLAATVCLAVLATEEAALSLGVVDLPVITAGSAANRGTSMAAITATVVTFAVLALVTVPVSEWLVRRKLARSRLRKAMLVALGMVLIRGWRNRARTASAAAGGQDASASGHSLRSGALTGEPSDRELKSSKGRLPEAVASAAIATAAETATATGLTLEHEPAGGSAPPGLLAAAKIAAAAAPPSPGAASPGSAPADVGQPVHFAITFRRDFLLMTVFSVVASVSGAYATRAVLTAS